MIDHIPDANKSKALTLLRLLLFSDRPLTLDEIVDALAVDTESSLLFQPNYRMPRPVQDICFYCPNLIRLEKRWVKREGFMKDPPFKQLREVRFTHFSVKEYLISDRLKPELRQQMQVSVSRTSLATICVAYLLSISQDMPKSRSKKEFPFARYSAQSWLSHAGGQRTTDKGLHDMVIRFLLHREAAYRKWSRLYGPDASHRISYDELREYGVGAIALHYSCLHGLSPVVETLLARSVDVNAFGGRYFSPLNAAAARGHLQIVQSLLGHGAKADLRGRYDQTALTSAVSNGHVGIARCLLDYGADANTIDVMRESVLGVACEKGDLKMTAMLIERGASIEHPSALAAACSRGQTEVAHYLLKRGADIHGLSHLKRGSLSAAARYGSLETVSLLLDAGAGLTRQPKEADGPISCAATQGHWDVVQFLLTAGTVDKQDLGQALAEACHGGNVHVARLLLDVDADVNAFRSRLRSTPLQIACSNGLETLAKAFIQRGANVNGRATRIPGAGVGSALERAARRRDSEDLVRFLLDNGAIVNANYWGLWPDRSTGSGALVEAAHRGSESLARLFLDLGADVNSSRCDSALQLAMSNGHIRVAQILLDHGASVERAPAGHLNDSPLLGAYKQRNWAMCVILLDKGASVHTPAAMNDQFRTFLDVVCLKGDMLTVVELQGRGIDLSSGLSPACLNGHLELAQLLVDSGVKPDSHNKRFGSPLEVAASGGHERVVEFLTACILARLRIHGCE